MKRSIIPTFINDLKYLFNIEIIAGKESHYQNKNIYYDTFDYKFYREKTEGYSIRKKIRIRISNYLKDLKISRSQIEVKNRRGFDSEKDVFNIENLEKFNYEKLNEYLLDNYNVYLKEKVLPLICTKYDRKSYISNIYNDFRFTIDTNIITSAYNKNTKMHNKGFFIIDPNYSILEFKLGGSIPLFLKNVINKYYLEQVTFSKYARSIELLYEKQYNLN